MTGTQCSHLFYCWERINIGVEQSKIRGRYSNNTKKHKIEKFVYFLKKEDPIKFIIIIQLLINVLD